MDDLYGKKNVFVNTQMNITPKFTNDLETVVEFFFKSRYLILV